ncbi:hypothetical protein J2129_001136 [Methanofollis sp. W23]|uniref:hypothetical protein n=1 Tax=Methanofollis sp. W23 TaxID=2817849 RepID=UPI001AE589DC|nr:hypothetical protein [Methanofollis sp. W23]MBP2145682.1 hypothetical protein [Methanofollis sp. W23]
MPLDKNVLTALEEETGPSASYVLSRSAKKALNKSPASLTVTDLPALADACYSAAVPVLGTEASGKIKNKIEILLRV